MTSRRPGAFTGSCAITHPAALSLVGGHNGDGGGGGGGGQNSIRWCKLLTVANSFKLAHSSWPRRRATEHVMYVRIIYIYIYIVCHVHTHTAEHPFHTALIYRLLSRARKTVSTYIHLNAVRNIISVRRKRSYTHIPLLHRGAVCCSINFGVLGIILLDIC